MNFGEDVIAKQTHILGSIIGSVADEVWSKNQSEVWSKNQSESNYLPADT